MVQKRTVLEHLTRDELISIADAFDVHVPDRRSKEKLVEAVAASRSATLAAFLQQYSRDRLKERICTSTALPVQAFRGTCAASQVHWAFRSP